MALQFDRFPVQRYAELEPLARALCAEIGIDPDQEVSHGADAGPSGAVCDILLYSPRWQRVAREIDLIERVVRLTRTPPAGG